MICNVILDIVEKVINLEMMVEIGSNILDVGVICYVFCFVVYFMFVV